MTRAYTSPTREADAAQTRARIVDAAARLFVRDGYAATPLKAIAAEAGVSVQSVHIAGPKSSLLIAAFERSFAGDEGRHPLAERPAMVEIASEPDNTVALAMYAEFLTEANMRSASIVRALKAATDADPLAREAFVDLETRRKRDMGIGAGMLIARGLVDSSKAAVTADVLGYLTGPDAYLHFVEDSGWTVEQYSSWLIESIHALVIDAR